MQDLSTIATDQEAATDWVKNNVARYMFPGGVKIRWVAVGNEAFGTWQYVSPATRHSRHVICSYWRLSSTFKACSGFEGLQGR